MQTRIDAPDRPALRRVAARLPFPPTALTRPAASRP